MTDIIIIESTAYGLELPASEVPKPLPPKQRRYGFDRVGALLNIAGRRPSCVARDLMPRWR